MWLKLNLASQRNTFELEMQLCPAFLGCSEPLCAWRIHSAIMCRSVWFVAGKGHLLPVSWGCRKKGELFFMELLLIIVFKYLTALKLLIDLTIIYENLTWPGRYITRAWSAQILCGQNEERGFFFSMGMVCYNPLEKFHQLRIVQGWQYLAELFFPSKKRFKTYI